MKKNILITSFLLFVIQFSFLNGKISIIKGKTVFTALILGSIYKAIKNYVNFNMNFKKNYALDTWFEVKQFESKVRSILKCNKDIRKILNENTDHYNVLLQLNKDQSLYTLAIKDVVINKSLEDILTILLKDKQYCEYCEKTLKKQGRFYPSLPYHSFALTYSNPRDEIKKLIFDIIYRDKKTFLKKVSYELEEFVDATVFTTALLSPWLFILNYLW